MKLAILLLFFFLIPFAFAKDITFSLNQSDYYVLVGQDAILPLEVKNTYKTPISGMLTVHYSQEVSSSNTQISQQQTNSQSLSVDSGEHFYPIGFGSSNTPLTIHVSLHYVYTEKDKREVNLEDISIHFVSDQSEQQNKKKQQQSKSKKTKDQPPPPDQQTQQRLQENQRSTDSNALKQQIQEELSKQQQLDEAFQQALSQNQDFAQKHQELLDQGYELSSGSVDAQTENSGSFDLSYQKEGNAQSLEGQMTNGSMDHITSSLDQEQLLSELRADPRFSEYDSTLSSEGFAEQNVSFYENNTRVEVAYQNEKNQSATIIGSYVNQTLQEVKLEQSRNYSLLWLLLIPLAVLLYFLKPKKEQNIIREKKEPFNYKKESYTLLSEAKKLFLEKHYKDSYSKAAQSLRLYLSHSHHLNKEVTSDEIITYLRSHKKQHTPIKECFDLCSMVEFAKYQANKKDFDKIVAIVEKTISRDESS